MFWPHGMELIVSDPDYVQDLYQTHDKVFDKQEHAKNLFSDLVWNSLLFKKTAEPSYKPRRKLITHAFYASKLRGMSEIILKAIHQRLLKWNTLYPEGELDLVKELI